jgi:zinc protease
VVQNPIFPDDAVESERAALLGEIALSRDDMYRRPLRMAVHAAFENHPYGRPVQGTEESVRRIGVDQLREWHSANACAAQFALGIVADADEEELAIAMATAFSNLDFKGSSSVVSPAWPAQGLVRIEEREKAQTALALLYPSVNRSHPDRHAAEVLANIASGLGGRLFDELRERQSLAYTVLAYPVEWRRAGAFASYIATSPDKEQTALDGLKNEIRKFREEEVSDDELSRAQEYMVGTRAIRLQSGGARLAEMLDAWMYGEGLVELSEAESTLRALTPQMLLQFARERSWPSWSESSWCSRSSRTSGSSGRSRCSIRTCARTTA